MDIGIDNLVYVLMGVVFILAQFLRSEAVETVPPVDTEPASFQRIDPGITGPIHPEGSLTDKHDLAEAGLIRPAKPPDDEQEESLFDLRCAVIQSVILE